MTELYRSTWLSENKPVLPAWQSRAYDHFTEMLSNKEIQYPCIPAQLSFSSDQLRFGFVGDPTQRQSSKELAGLLKKYGAISRETGKFASFVVFFDTSEKIKEDFNVENYRQLFWSILNILSEEDSVQWPEHISQNPSDPRWEFCFDGEPYFCFCATPAHHLRKSRHFPCFLITFQPRWVFEEINDGTPLGRNLKKAIRSRLEAYDETGIHPSLKWYGQSDNLEWKQYFLPDDNSIPSKCPFSQMRKLFIK
ncbi:MULTISPECIES: YqcI/YcgG family protein [unclassified Bacillus (in: firmicutes)]|uniref:YqcI/YcgG family protein n=1 Tax=unclassified Bacillus (in: firmicutes) TaxID=185979 RepID=UPI0008E79444|nr:MULTISPECIES: YqcI/YcgG family protein [unclassified Bacillus (in: firmicutes)]SFB02834.1 hypothetical protein SAMN02799634_104123 [Bacillus sp. UNCCL13]SFQ88977.1 hypothetical protein SAMN04488577_3390 [Bacillus sp. cl95]